MKSMFIRTLAVATLASSISAFAAIAPAIEDPAKDAKTSMACPPADNGSAQMAEGQSKSDRKMKKEQEKKMKKDHNQEDDETPLYGIYG